MREKPEHWLSSNMKYWLLGSLICLNAGWAVLIIGEILLYKFYIDSDYYYSFMFYCFGPFVGALYIKLLKKDIPWYIYSTTGIFYIIICKYFSNSILYFVGRMTLHCYEIEMNLHDTLHFQQFVYNYPHSPHYYGKLVLFLSIILFTSFLGGFIVDAYRYFKQKYSD